MQNHYEPTIEDVSEISGIDTLPPGRLDIAREMAELSGMKSGKNVLVVSSQRGYQAILYAEEFKVKVTGIDSSEEMIETAKQKSEESNQNIEFVMDEYLNMPFNAEQFDIVTGEGNVGRSKQPVDTLKEMFRVLKKDGVLVFRDAIFKEDLNMDEMEEICNSYGKKVYNKLDWQKIISEAGGEVIIISDEKWSNPEVFWNVRHDHMVNNFTEMYSVMEKLKLSKKLMKHYGKQGIEISSHNEQVFYKAVCEQKIGYGIFVARRK